MTEHDIDLEAWKAEAQAVNLFMAERGDFSRAPVNRPESSYYNRIMAQSGGTFTVPQIAERIKANPQNLSGALRTLLKDGKLCVVGKTETGARIYAASTPPQRKGETV